MGHILFSYPTGANHYAGIIHPHLPVHLCTCAVMLGGGGGGGGVISCSFLFYPFDAIPQSFSLLTTRHNIF